MRKPSLITGWAVNCWGSNGCYIIYSLSIVTLVYIILKGMASTKRNAPLSLSLALFFTANVTRTKQWFDCGLNNVKLQNFFTILLTFFQILGSNIRFPKNPKSTHTVNLYSEFSCKSRFAKVNFATRHILRNST